ncbi:PAS domain S-box protein [Sphingomonas sp. BN140010]|uniref:histidine kinase n=1 Tax=Sphingomonas arvum TaxID=2992113 RepID=A0ABT3JG31_9SPHN|nr:HWE histidine kinase domain-containing protein [Sphingomonas sp. BN140010]MCW3798020.1 PAS domain S-box protein [Sphingomonas sp. BN140010]
MAEPVGEAPYFLQGDGEMGARMRAHDWSATVLGPPAGWPVELQVALSICLQSSVPMAIYWGPRLKLLYNDAWAPIPAERHPWALGKPGAEVWPEIWDVVGPQLHRVMASGVGFSALNQLLMMERQGRQRETWWNYSFTPIMGADGKVLGILNEGLEVTDRVQLEQRQDFLLRLSDALRGLADPRAIIRTAQRMLGERLGANRVGYGEVDETERWFTTAETWVNGVSPRDGTHDLAAFGKPVWVGLRSGEPLVVEDTEADPRMDGPDVRAAFAAIDVRSALTTSLVKDGRMVGVLYVHAKEPRAWSRSDSMLLSDVAERIWAEVARAGAEALASATEERFRRIFEQTSDLIVTSTLDRTITSANPAAAAALGLEVSDLIGRKTSDFVLADSQSISDSMLRRKLQEGGTTRYEVLVRGRSGEPLSVEINSGLTYDGDGQPVGVHLVARDNTERKKWENHQRLLVGELNHRVKNTLAIVQSLTHQTFRAGSPPEQSIRAFEGRLQALAAAHNLLTRENWEAASIGDVVEGALRPFCSDARCTIKGPPARVPPQTAVSLTLTMHELATNASKYGSLSVPEGTIAVRWATEDGRLMLEWTEAGGPLVAPPTRSGFGTRLINRALAADLGGTVNLDYAPDGVRCRIEAPLP